MDFLSTLEYLNCAFVNIQSVNWLNEQSLHVLVISQTWLGEYDSSRIIEMTTATHTFLHSPREGRRGGGVGIFLSNTFSHLRVLTPLRVSSLEYIQISFKYQSQWIVHIVIYRPPWSNINIFFRQFSALLDSIEMVSFKIFIVGD